MSFIDLKWNTECSVLWASNKVNFETRFALLKWNEYKGGSLKMPFQVGFEIAEFCKKGGILNVSAIAWDLLPGNMIYGLKASYKDGEATLYLHSNMKQVVLIASKFEPKKVSRETQPKKP